MAISEYEADEIPSQRGTYALLLFCRRFSELRIGRLGRHPLARGWYVYVGSAFGPGGLRARCRHHLKALRRPRWHIDYLRPAATLQDIWFTCDSVPREHLWVQRFGGLPGAIVPIPRFGSSDCTCPGHLFRCPSRPSFSIFKRLTRRGISGHGPIKSLSPFVDEDHHSTAAATRQAR
jgi:Uri superfamily endonuclease